MTYPPTGNDPHGQQPGPSDPYAVPAPTDPTAPPTVSQPHPAPPAHPYSAPVSADPYAAPPAPASADPYAANPYAQPGAYGQPPVYGQSPAYGQQPSYGQPAGYANPYGAAYGQVPPTGKTNTFAIASLVLGICGVVFCFCYGFGFLPGIVGAILGHVGMKQIRERNENGRGMALAGVITGWSAVALSIVFWILLGIVIANDPNFTDNFNDFD